LALVLLIEHSLVRRASGVLLFLSGAWSSCAPIVGRSSIRCQLTSKSPMILFSWWDGSAFARANPATQSPRSASVGLAFVARRPGRAQARSVVIRRRRPALIRRHVQDARRVVAVWIRGDADNLEELFPIPAGEDDPLADRGALVSHGFADRFRQSTYAAARA
jgi:hypothetical protein